jgi:biopolymer transport protein ExbD
LETWDVFHSDRLEVERALTTAEVRAALARGDLREDDLIRTAGASAPWARLADMPALLAPEPEPEPEPPPAFDDNDDNDDDDLFVLETLEDAQAGGRAAAVPAVGGEADSALDLNLRDHEGMDAASSLELVTWDDDLDQEEYDPQEEDEAAAEFTLSRGSAETVEELDLAAMVDVAFQLVLFFLVTATTILYKSLEVPKPNPENNPSAAAAQGRPKSLEDLKDDFILVEIDPAGAVKIDREPAPSDMTALIARLRAARERTGRKAMLLSADFATPHKSAVLAYDAANEIGLGIAIARPSQNPAPPAPAPAPAPAAGSP